MPAANVISEAEDKAPIMEALLLSGENTQMVTVKGDGNCLPHTLAGFKELPGDSPCNLCWDWLGWGHITNKADAKRWAAKCRIDGEWLETDFILAYCHMHRINMTITMIDWRVVESGCRELYLKQFLTGALDKPRYSHRLLAYIN